MDPALTELLLRSDEAAEDPVVEAIVRLRRPGLEVPGVRIVSRFGSIATCRLAASAIREVRQHPNVASLKAPRRLGPEPGSPDPGDASIDPSGLPPTDIRRPPGLSLTGAGVVVGVVDWGLDIDHPNFKNPDGTTRLLAVWDQANNSGASPRPYGYGTVHKRDDINAALRSSQPYETLRYHPARADRGGGSHGTHVVDIAAGNGRAGGPVGIAPLADLVFVDLADRDTGGLANLGGSVRLCEAVDFCARVAGSKPWVINLSIGRHGGPHDGSTLTELAFDELLDAAPGRFIAQSTGNYYRAGVHASGMLATGQSQTLQFNTDPRDITDNELEIWYDGDDEFAVSIEPPGGVGPVVRLGSRADLIVDGQLVGRVHHRAGDPNNGDNHVDAFLYAPARAGSWTVTVYAVRARNGRFDAWLERDEACPGCQARFIGDDRDPTCSTGTIANSHLPMVVGAYDAHQPARPVARFSSRGPTRDGRDKPDVAAPGVRIRAARSASVGALRSPGAHVRKSGSSMATPHVTGAIALCLQAAGNRLSASQIRGLVFGTADAPLTEPKRLGRGYLNIPALIAAVRTALPDLRDSEAQAEPRPAFDRDAVLPLMLAPATAYRELLYRPGAELSRWIGERFEILARPGRSVVEPPRAGDVLLTVTLGQPGVGACGVLTDANLTRRRVAHGSGWYCTVTGATAARRRRVLDLFRCVPPGHLLLRQRRKTIDAMPAGSAHTHVPVPVEIDVEQNAPSTEVTKRPALRRHSRGPLVTAIQTMLNAVRAVPTLEVDGDFGPRTESAVKFFQNSHRLTSDGIVGPATKAMLDREVALHGVESRDPLQMVGPCHTSVLPGPDDATFTAAAAPFAAVDAPPTPQPAPDLVVQLTSDSVSDALAAAHGRGAAVVKVTSPDDLRTLLAGKKTVGRLVVVSHATTQGELRFDIGTAVSTVNLSDLAAKIRKSATVREIVFLGCDVGKDPDGLGDIKQALTASAAEGTDCHLIAQKIGPLTADGAAVDTEQKYQALSAQAKTVYNKALREQAVNNRGECLVQLKPNQKLKDVTGDQLRAFAMQHGGVLITHFTQEDGVCWKDLKFDGPGRCHRVHG